MHAQAIHVAVLMTDETGDDTGEPGTQACDDRGEALGSQPVALSVEMLSAEGAGRYDRRAVDLTQFESGRGPTAGLVVQNGTHQPGLLAAVAELQA